MTPTRYYDDLLGRLQELEVDHRHELLGLRQASRRSDQEEQSRNLAN
jgi:hypothetical protein